VSREVTELIVTLRQQRPTWGPKKLRDRLTKANPSVAWPSETTFARILSREGLSQDRKPARRVPLAEHPPSAPRAPNDVWCADFKGKFRVGRQYCHPLTVTDAFSRFVLCCRDTGAERFEPTRAAFEQTFREYGLPLRIKTDNGSPFASLAVGGLSQLSLWWVKLGILPERSRPGHPEDNGRHERMHRTLKAETARPPKSTLDAQQAAFDAWVLDKSSQATVTVA
jgi:transposase InsO family protein